MRRNFLKYFVAAIILFWAVVAFAQQMPQWTYTPSQNWQIIFVAKIDTTGQYPVVSGVCVTQDRRNWSVCEMETILMEKRERLGAPVILAEYEVPHGFILVAVGVNEDGGMSFYCGLVEDVNGFRPFWDCSNEVGTVQLQRSRDQES